MLQYRRAAICWLLLGVVCLGCGPTQQPLRRSADGATQVKLALNWFPEPEHGGFYAALLNGHFADEGLEVEIQPGGPGSPVIEKLVRGQVQFSVANADEVLLKRNQGTDVLCVLAPLQSTPRCIMVHEESGIERLEDLANLNLAMNKGKAFAEYIERHCPLPDVRIVQYNGRIGPFVANKQYAQQAYVFSEPILARREGARPRVLMVSELGYNPYTSGIVVTREFAESSPNVVQRFVRACQRGWEDYLADPTRVNQELMRLNSELDEDSLRQAHQVLLPLCQMTDQEPLGAMSAERWQTLKDQLVEIEFIEPALDVSQAFDNGFATGERTP